MPRKPSTPPVATDADPAPRSAGGSIAVRRALRLLELLSEGDGPWTLADLARDLAVNKAIASRLLDDLASTHFVFRDQKTGAYALTYKLSNLGLRKLAQTRVLDQSSGVLRDLANTTGELVRIAVVEPGERLTWVLAFVGARRTLHIDPNYRLEVGFNTHAAGKAWLLTMSPEHAWSFLRTHGIEKLTAYSKTTRQDIEADLAHARRRGYAESSEENELGVRAIAAPVIVDMASGERTCVAVVSVAAPTSRLSRRALDAHAPVLLKAVSTLGQMWPIGAPSVQLSAMLTDP